MTFSHQHWGYSEINKTVQFRSNTATETMSFHLNAHHINVEATHSI